MTDFEPQKLNLPPNGQTLSKIPQNSIFRPLVKRIVTILKTQPSTHLSNT